LMSNHYHLVLKTPEPNLVMGMKWLQSTWTERFNARHGNLTLWMKCRKGRSVARSTNALSLGANDRLEEIGHDLLHEPPYHPTARFS
jgi:hypothetical protein